MLSLESMDTAWHSIFAFNAVLLLNHVFVVSHGQSTQLLTLHSSICSTYPFSSLPSTDGVPELEGLWSDWQGVTVIPSISRNHFWARLLT